MVQRAAAAAVPFVPAGDGFGGQVAVQLIAGVVHPHHAADVVGGGEGVGNGAGVDDGNGVPAAAQFQGGAEAENAGAGNGDSGLAAVLMVCH